MITSDYPYIIEIDINTIDMAKVFRYAINAKYIKDGLLKGIFNDVDVQLNHMIDNNEIGVLCIPVNSFEDALGLGHVFNHVDFTDILERNGFNRRIWRDVQDLIRYNIIIPRNMKYDGLEIFLSDKEASEFYTFQGVGKELDAYFKNYQRGM